MTANQKEVINEFAKEKGWYTAADMIRHLGNYPKYIPTNPVE